MNEKEYKKEIARRLPREGDVPLTLIRLADKAVREYPSSVDLWLMRGALIQLGPEKNPFSLDDALRSYQEAARIDPDNPEPYEEMAHFFDAVMDDEKTAKRHFAKARRLKNKKEATKTVQRTSHPR